MIHMQSGKNWNNEKTVKIKNDLKIFDSNW